MFGTYSNIEVYIEKQWSNPHFMKVWIYAISGERCRTFYPTSDQTKVIVTEVGKTMPNEPSLYIETDILKALVDGLTPQFPPSEVMNNHLKDAIMVRDRLLKIVETREGEGHGRG
jgi:hypothetical protein